MSEHRITVTIRGPQGSGKTRLADELAKAAGDLGFAVDRKDEGRFKGGTYLALGDSVPRILIEETLS